MGVKKRQRTAEWLQNQVGKEVSSRVNRILKKTEGPKEESKKGSKEEE